MKIIIKTRINNLVHVLNIIECLRDAFVKLYFLLKLFKYLNNINAVVRLEIIISKGLLL